MTELDPRQKKRPFRPQEAGPATPPSALIVGWLAPLTKAAPRAMREIATRVERVATRPARAIPAPITRMPPFLIGFLLIVLAPAFATSVYFALFASDQYAIEARLAVRSLTDGDFSDSSQGGGGGASLGFAGMGGGGGGLGYAGSGGGGGGGAFSFTATGQNAYIVTSYIRSRGIVDDLSAKLDLRAIFRRPEADFFSRLNHDASAEQLLDYWNGHVDTYVDQLSSIVTLRIRAFRREDALALGNAVIEASEALVNRISDRARHDAMAMAEKEVRRSFAVVQKALAALSEFRNSSGMIDPGQTGGEIGKLLVPMIGEKIKLETELSVLAHELSDDAPSVRVLREKVAAIDEQIDAQKARLTGQGGSVRTIAGSLARFEELEVQRLLAERFYSLAQADYDRAQLRASRQTVYLTVFAPPALPEESRYPRRWAFSILTFLGLAAVWAIGAMILASVEDHRL